MARYYKTIICISVLYVIYFIDISYAWDLNITGRVRETFDDNIGSVVETLLVKKRYDFITELMVGLGLHHEGKTFTFNIMGHVNQQLYSMNFGLTNNNQDVTMNLAKSFSELVNFQFSDIFQNYPEPERYEELFGNTQGRMRYWRNSFNLTGSFEVNKYYVISVIYSNQFSKYFYTRTKEWHIQRLYYRRFTDNDLKYSHVNTARIQHEVHWDSSNNSYLFYEYQWTKSDPGGILQVHRPGFGYRYDFTKQLYIEGRISPDFVFTPRIYRGNISAYGLQYVIPPATPYDISLYAFLLLSHDVDKKTNARLNFTYQNSVLANNADPTTNWRIQGDLTRQIFDRLLFTSSVFYGESYTFARKTTNRLFGFSLSATYEFTEHISATISYNLTFNLSHVTGTRLFDGYVYNNGAYEKEDSGYYRNRASIGVNAAW